MAISLRALLNNPNLLNKLRQQQDPNALYHRNPATGEYEPTDLYWERIGEEVERHPIHTPRTHRG